MVFYTVFFDNLKIWLLDEPKKEKINKNLKKIEIIDNRITKEYLLWFLNKKEVQEYIKELSSGSFAYSHISIKLIKELKITIPTLIEQRKAEKEEKEFFSGLGSKYQILFQKVYKEYQECRKRELDFSAMALVGFLGETFLLESIKKLGVKKYIWEGKMFGYLIDVVGKNEGIPEEDLKFYRKISKARNNIHPFKAVQNKTNINKLTKEAFKAFDELIQRNGINFE